ALKREISSPSCSISYSASSISPQDGNHSRVFCSEVLNPPFNPLQSLALTLRSLFRHCPRSLRRAIVTVNVSSLLYDLNWKLLRSKKRNFNSTKAVRTPPGSGRKQQLASLGEWMNSSAGMAFSPHVISVEPGEPLILSTPKSPSLLSRSAQFNPESSEEDTGDFKIASPAAKALLFLSSLHFRNSFSYPNNILHKKAK
ncbi:hypothetical protein S83_047598, partial [Arachis hypogaea]